jgi:hypothetical protein
MGRSDNKINVICSNMCETLKRNKRIGLPYTDLYTTCLNSQFGWIMVGFSVSQMNHWFSFPICWPPRDGIDAADTLGQHSVGNQFRQLRTPWGGQHGNRGTLAGQKFASHLESCWMHLAPAKTPQVGGQDSIPWDPVGIDIGQHLNCILAAELWAVSTPDLDTSVYKPFHNVSHVKTPTVKMFCS